MSDLMFTDEELMAYADGELAEGRASEIDVALARVDALAQRLALFVDTRANVASAYAPMLDEPVPDELRRQVEELARKSDADHPQAPQEDTVVAFRPKPAQNAAPRQSFWKMPLAASVALAIGVGTGLFLAGNQPTGGLQIAALDDPEIVRALTEMPAGDSKTLDSGSRIEVIATFLDDSGAVCREFEYDHAGGSTFVAVTCHDTTWDVKFVVAAAPSGDTGFAPASSLATLDAYLVAIGAQAPLSIQDEIKALSTLK